MGKKRVRNNKSNKPLSLSEFQNFQSTIQLPIESVEYKKNFNNVKKIFKNDY